MSTDRYGREWPDLTANEACPECGQPDNCGDCTHAPLTCNQAVRLGAKVPGNDMTMPQMVSFMSERLTAAGITTRAAAEALTVSGRDKVLDVAAWSGYEDLAWEAALSLFDPTSNSVGAFRITDPPDPFPVGTVVEIRDHDGTIIDAEFLVVRSYWPAAVCEVVTTDSRWPGMTRNPHDRLIRKDPT